MSLEDRLQGNEITWRPIDDDTHPKMLIGDIVDVDKGEGDYGEFPILTIRDEKGQEWRWSVFGGVAQGRINKLNPQIGDRIGAKYLGTEPSRNFPNKTYHDWKIVCERNANYVGVIAPTVTRNANYTGVVAPIVTKPQLPASAPLPNEPGFDDF